MWANDNCVDDFPDYIFWHCQADLVLSGDFRRHNHSMLTGALLSILAQLRSSEHILQIQGAAAIGDLTCVRNAVVSSGKSHYCAACHKKRVTAVARAFIRSC